MTKVFQNQIRAIDTHPIVESDIVNSKETARSVISPDSLNYNLQKKVKTGNEKNHDQSMITMTMIMIMITWKLVSVVT